jgi:hypothetical protein
MNLSGLVECLGMGWSWYVWELFQLWLFGRNLGNVFERVVLRFDSFMVVWIAGSAFYCMQAWWSRWEVWPIKHRSHHKWPIVCRFQHEGSWTTGDAGWV